MPEIVKSSDKILIFQEPSVFLERTANPDGGVGVPIGSKLPVTVERSPTQAGIFKILFYPRQ